MEWIINLFLSRFSLSLSLLSSDNQGIRRLNINVKYNAWESALFWPLCSLTYAKLYAAIMRQYGMLSTCCAVITGGYEAYQGNNVEACSFGPYVMSYTGVTEEQ